MNRVFLRVSLCVALSFGSCVVAAECATCEGTACFNAKFETMLNRQRKTAVLKATYKNLINRVVATFEDKEVTAARGELYKAAKKVVNVAQKRLKLTPEDMAHVLCLGEALKKRNESGVEALTEEEITLLEAFQLMAVELPQEYPVDKLQRMFDREVELFNQN